MQVDRSSGPGPWFADLTDEEIWTLYDLVTARTVALEHAEDVAMQNLGAQPWRELKAKLRRAVDSQKEPT